MRPCKACGRKLWFVEHIKPDGKKSVIPLDVETPVYDVMCYQEGGKPVELANRINAFVSHFVTCPQANKFSKGNKNAQSPSALPESVGRDQLLPGSGPAGSSAPANAEPGTQLPLGG